MRTRLFPLGFSVFDTFRAALPGGFTATIGGWTLPAGTGVTRRRRVGFFVAALPVAALLVTWLGVRTFPWFGPMLADNLRLVVGSEAVTRLEGWAADVEDRIKLTVGTQAPRGLADATPPDVAVALAVPSTFQPSQTAFHPRDVGPMHRAVASADDGVWQPVALRGAGSPAMSRTILHPDPRRAHAELFVFALDLTQLSITAAAGTVEPKHLGPAGNRVPHAGVVAPSDRERLVAAFNGGFKAEHGQFGMMVNGVELLAPRATSCTFAATADGQLRIATWQGLRSGNSDFSWWRQTPACMAEGGELHPLLRTDSKSWGATVDGDTVIRRSAVGLDKAGKTLFVAISNSTTARALATGMQHAGADDVAQLDVNHSFPKFLLYRGDSPEQLSAIGAVKGFLYESGDYVQRASTRDFFYVTRR